MDTGEEGTGTEGEGKMASGREGALLKLIGKGGSASDCLIGGVGGSRNISLQAHISFLSLRLYTVYTLIMLVHQPWPFPTQQGDRARRCRCPRRPPTTNSTGNPQKIPNKCQQAKNPKEKNAHAFHTKKGRQTSVSQSCATRASQ